jgi:hypothetical protein
MESPNRSPLQPLHVVLVILQCFGWLYDGAGFFSLSTGEMKNPTAALDPFRPSGPLQVF